jgi:hypothetical protein
MPEIITRKEAIERGLKRYFTGNPCCRGHFSERLASIKACAECLRTHHKKIHAQSSRIANKKWRVENPERVAQYRLNDALKERENGYRKSKWAKANPEKYRASKRKTYLKNREKYLTYNRNYRINGPSNPKGELQWLRKNKLQLRGVRRLLRSLSRGQPPSPSSAFTTPTGSPR